MYKNFCIKILIIVVSIFCVSTTPRANQANELIIFTWSEYIPYDVLEEFTSKTGIKVSIATFESNEAMYAKLKVLGGKGYDIIMPTGYFVEKLCKDNLLARIDKFKLQGMSNIDGKVLNQGYDPNNEYSIPYMWGAVGLLVNKSSIDPKKVVSFNDLQLPELKGKILLSDDMRDTFGIALKACGFSVNTKDPKEVKVAYEWLKKVKPSVRVFDVTATKQAFISEEVVAGMCWNGDAFIAIQENENLEFIVPKEGLILWIDNFAILEQAENKENAYLFINFMLQPEIAKRCVTAFNYTTPNIAAKKMLDPLYRESKVMFPDRKALVGSEIITSVGKTFEVYAKYWDALKSGREGKN